LEVKIRDKKFIVSFSFILNLPFLLLFNPYRKHQKIMIENKEYKMYVVDNIFSQIIGYRFRSPNDIKENEIMLFKFKKENEYSFWMKNVYFPIKLCSCSFDLDNLFLENCLTLDSNNCKKCKIKGNNILEFPLSTEHNF
jgi:uncharacterized membrane protein (UPF0127 family)